MTVFSKARSVYLTNPDAHNLTPKLRLGYVLPLRGELQLNRVRRAFPAAMLAAGELSPEFLSSIEGAQRASSRTAQSGEFSERLEHRRQPSFQQRAFDLHDIPVQYEK